MRVFGLNRIAYLEDLERDPEVRFKIMHNPDGGWDEEALKEIGFFKILHPGEKNSGPGLLHPRIWADEEFRYGYARLTGVGNNGPSAWVEVNKKVVPKADPDGVTMPYNPGINSLEPADPISIWDSTTRTLIFMPSFNLLPGSLRGYLKSLAEWLDSHHGHGSGSFNYDSI